MHLKELINRSVYGTIGYISSQLDIDLLEQYILFNLPVLKEFKQIIVATNFKEQNKELSQIHKAKWEEYFKSNIIIIDSDNNRGHNHGYTDLDNILIDYCKEHNIEWICKGANDVIFTESILNKEIKEADFYYLNGIGFGGLQKYNFDFNKIILEDFYPQTNFYLINVHKIDYLNNKEYLDKTYNQIQQIKNYNGKIWEYIPNWSCEEFLKQCVIRNDLIKEHLIPEEKYITLLNIIKEYNIHDCSHKNIMIEGICHFPYPDQQIIEI